jgi:hypothetical protein
MTPRRRRRPDAPGGALAAAIRSDDWERAALYLLLGFAHALRTYADGDIEDVLALLSEGEEVPRDGVSP